MMIIHPYLFQTNEKNIQITVYLFYIAFTVLLNFLFLCCCYDIMFIVFFLFVILYLISKRKILTIVPI
jgi:hypothetical protein